MLITVSQNWCSMEKELGKEQLDHTHPRSTSKPVSSVWLPQFSCLKLSPLGCCNRKKVIVMVIEGNNNSSRIIIIKSLFFDPEILIKTLTKKCYTSKKILRSCF